MRNELLLVLAAYAIGSIPTGYWLGKAWHGIDIRKFGSGNLGATNVFRVLGKGPGIITLILDILKGLLPVMASHHMFPGMTEPALLSGIAAIAGHATSPFVGFKGGKGVATSAGVFIALLPIPAMIAILVFVACLMITKIVSISSMSGAIAMAIAAAFLSPTRPLVWMTFAIAAFVFWTHRANLRRLRAGTEPKISAGGHKHE